MIDSRWKVTGQAVYGDDVRLPGEIIGRLVRSDRHYAKVLSIDMTDVESIPGVLATATGIDAPSAFGVLPVTKDEHAMALEKSGILATLWLVLRLKMKKLRGWRPLQLG